MAVCCNFKMCANSLVRSVFQSEIHISHMGRNNKIIIIIIYIGLLIGWRFRYMGRCSLSVGTSGIVDRSFCATFPW